MPQEKPSQSQSIIGSSVSASQVGQAGANLYQSQINPPAPIEIELTAVEVIEYLRKIEELLLQDKNLPKPEKETALHYLDAAKKETKQKEPDKEIAAKNLKRVSDTVKTTSETVKTVKELWNNMKPILIRLHSWLGVAKNFFGF